MSLKYALIHEWLTPKATGGSELVVRDILKHINADLYALIDFESSNPESYLFNRVIGTTFLQHFPLARNGVQKYLPLLPFAIEQLDLRDYDVILSSSHAVAKGVLTTPNQLHICYCHTPMRYAWDLTFDYLRSSRAGSGLPGVLTRYILHQLRQWDVLSANRVDYFIANSQYTARRIWRCYRREAKIIYPPIDLDRFQIQTKKQEYYLTVCRLVSYKKISLIVNAFNQLGRPLVVIGTGSQLHQIKQMAKSNVQVLGWQPNEIVQQYMSEAKAFVYMACEDLGMALIEAQACGTPVIAYGAGGATETVRDIHQYPDSGTGLLFWPQTETALMEAVQKFEQLSSPFEPQKMRSHVAQFDRSRFGREYLEFVEQCQKKQFPRENFG
ncbi:MAG: glycosyltransferase [Cyanobacteriota bacterium]|nr:glycosyltransferase [Cyanobacteriota bacterium]